MTGESLEENRRRQPRAPQSEPAPPATQIEIVRSARRRRTVSARRDGDRVVIQLPARLSRAEEERWVALMLQRLDRRDARRLPGDAELMTRALELSRRHLGGGARPVSVRWVDNMAMRWGSCTPADGTIRLSRRLEGMPRYVVDYVLVHELAHLLVAGHNARFWELVAAYPQTERARGYLEGVAATANLPLRDD